MRNLFPSAHLKNHASAIGTPVLIALLIVSLVSLGARIYRDQGVSASVQAETNE